MKNLLKISNKFINIGRSFEVKNIPLIAFSFLYYGIIIYLAARLNIWEDEVYSLNTSSGSLVYAFKQSFNFELQPPVYFLLLTIWRFVSDSIIWARLLSVVIIIVAQLYLYRFTLKVAGVKIATLISVLFLLNPYTLYAILEIRTFSLVLLVSIITMNYFYDSYYIGNCLTSRRVQYILISIFGLFTQYFIGFLLFSNAVVLLTEKKWRPLRLYIIDMIIPLLLLLLCAHQIVHSADLQESSVPLYNRSLHDLFLEIKVLFIQVPYNMFFMPSYFNLPQLLTWTIRGVFILCLLLSVNYIVFKKVFYETLPYIIISIVCYSFFLLLLLRFGKFAIVFKYTMILFITVLFVLIYALKIFKPIFLNSWIIILSMIYISKGYEGYKELYKVKDFRTLSSYIEEVEKDGEPVFIYRNISSENMGYYYKGKNMLIPLPASFSFQDDFGESDWKIETKFLNNLEKDLKDFDSFFLIVDNSQLRGVRESTEILVKFFTEQYQIKTKKVFRGDLELYRFTKE